MNRRKQLLFGLVAMAIALAFGLLALEILLRVLSTRQTSIPLAELESIRKVVQGQEGSLANMVTASDNKRLQYELIPNLRMFCGDREVVINSAGFRDEELTAPKTRGEFRIAVVGDSGTFGWRVSQDEGFTEMLETTLNRICPQTRFHVMNFGVPGYNTGMEHEVIKTKVLRYQPDLLVLQFDGNDVDLPNFLVKPESPWRLDRSFIVNFVRGRQFRWSKHEDKPEVSLPGLQQSPAATKWEFGKDGEGNLKVDRARVPDELQDTVGFDECAHWLTEIARRCEETKIPAFLFMNPNVVEAYTPEFTAKDDKSTVELVRAATAAGMRVIDPSLEIQAFCRRHSLTSRDLWVTPHTMDAHPVPARHVLMAKEIFGALAASKVLPEIVTSATVEQGRAWLDSETERQWQITLERDCPRSSPKAYEIRFGDGQRDQEILGEGWYEREKTATGLQFRWSRPEAQLRLPPCKRAALEISTDWPKQVTSPDYMLSVGDTPLTFTVKTRTHRGWLVFDIPEKLAGQPLDVRLKCKPLEIPDVVLGRPLGLLVYAVMIDPE